MSNNIVLEEEVFNKCCHYLSTYNTKEIENMLKKKDCYSIMEYAEKELNIAPSKWRKAHEEKDLKSIFSALALLNNSVEHPCSDSDDE